MSESVVRDALQAVYDAEGVLTPSLVLTQARSEAHPLHQFFEWDNSVAGEKFRLAQAQRLITTVKVVYRAESGERKKVRQWQAVQAPTQDWSYKPSEEVASDDILTKIILADMKRDWENLKKRYDSFAEFAVMIRGDLGKMEAA